MKEEDSFCILCSWKALTWLRMGVGGQQDNPAGMVNLVSLLNCQCCEGLPRPAPRPGRSALLALPTLCVCVCVYLLCTSLLHHQGKKQNYASNRLYLGSTHFRSMHRPPSAPH